MLVEAEDMASNYVKPDVRRVTSLRLPDSLRARIEVLRDLWRIIAEHEGVEADGVEAIDNTYVMLRQLQTSIEAELANFGGFPETEEARLAQQRALRASLKAQSKK